MSEEVENLLIEQSTAIASLKRVLVNFKKQAKANITLHKTRGRLTGLETQWDKCQQLHVRILQSATAEEQKRLPYFVNEEFLEAEDAYNEASDYLHELVGKLHTKIPPNTSPKTNESTFFESCSNLTLQLPRISLPKFSGQLTEWENFRGLFEALVASNEALSNTQKLHYLKAHVTEEASVLINNLKVSDANYESAWNLLLQEYDNNAAIIYAQIESFADLPIMKSETAHEFRRIRDSVSAALTALGNIGRPVEHWDDLLVYIVTKKFCQKTRDDWDLLRGSTSEYPTFAELREFLTTRIRGLARNSKQNNTESNSRGTKTRSSVNNVSAVKCLNCSNDHYVTKCQDFIGKSVDERTRVVKRHGCCFNCLKPGHFPPSCPNKGRCRRCGRKHHSLLHRDLMFKVRDSDSISTNTASIQDPPPKPSTSPEVTPPATVQTVQPSAQLPPNVLLPTAWVAVQTEEGRTFKVRAFLDQGATFSFISESLSQLMRTRRHRTQLRIRCFGDKFSGVSKSYVKLTLSPCSGRGPTFPLIGYVFQKITSYAASRIQPIDEWPHLRDLQLADTDPSGHQPIHLLIGADLYGSVLLNDLRRGPVGTPTAQLTVFGWILSGPTGKGDSPAESVPVLNCTSCSDLDMSLKRFWEDEDVPKLSSMSEDDEKCERHFVSTHSRTPQGRYTVRLPFKSGPPIDIGESLPIVSSLYSKMERRLRQQPEIADRYNDFLKEYDSLGHMKMVSENNKSQFLPVYIPHHFVLRESSSSTRLRVVFNASCKTNNGFSLNDYLLVGPKLQQDLPAILLRWRQFQYVCTADIEKMFRQILIHPDDADFQRILWRTDDGTIKHYQLLTVTYGLAPAPFLAMRVLRQLADDEGESFPNASPIIVNSMYVDDVLFGADEIDSLHETREQLIALMRRGGFQLRKWASNTLELLQDLPAEQKEMTDRHLTTDDTLKVLGLSWSPYEDAFRFVVERPSQPSYTKRSILSFISKVFDPLGWASPVVISAKSFMQELWLRQVDWDTTIPSDLFQQWNEYYVELPRLQEIRIPRWTGRHRDNLGIELHGFADASSKAYAAVIYLRVLHSLTDVQVGIIIAKTKVAPLRTVSIPRLELNAVVLLSRLMRWVQISINDIQTRCYGWTDSTIALAWLRQSPSKWKPYVANRVSEVQTSLPSMRWNHVNSSDNPADCASRGISASELIHHPLWWSGPPWLHKNSAFWPNSSEVSPFSRDTTETIQQEMRKAAVTHIDGLPTWDLPLRFSSWSRLVRVTAYVTRFIKNLKNRRKSLIITTSEPTADEIRAATEFWLRSTQQTHFPNERKALLSGTPLAKTSALRTLNPFIGSDDLIRLGGRLENAALSFNERHPVILPKDRIAELLVDQAHTATLHGGPQLTIRTLRQRYWILSARNLTKSRIRLCVVCARHSANPTTQIMGNLPPSRVTPVPPFSHTGVDYAGPMNIIPYVGRGQRSRKHYVAVFVCFATKAIHLECVEDYSTAGFLAAFRRFVSRRGLPTNVYSDNGTNFHGADRELQQHFNNFVNDSQLKDALAMDGVTWHFIPSAAPHFGGLWEAGVRSFKHHLRRVIGTRTLSLVEFQTLLCQIEACLNSRPISALSDDPTDLTVLTPGHFLIGRPLVSTPEETMLELDPNRLSRWQLVRAMQEQIWRAWSQDYLHTLQQRYKWSESSPEVKVNEVILIKNNLLPPSKWLLGRIKEVHPGKDGHIRVVTIRTASSVLKRPIAQICRLPVREENIDK